MVRFGAWLSIVAVATMQLPWVRCVAECHDVLHLSFDACPEDASHGEPSPDHEDADHESRAWDVSVRAARPTPQAARAPLAVAPALPACIFASVGPATVEPPLQASQPLLAPLTVVLLV